MKVGRAVVAVVEAVEEEGRVEGSTNQGILGAADDTVLSEVDGERIGRVESGEEDEVEEEYRRER